MPPPLKTPALYLHKTFKINARHIELVADIGNFCRIGLMPLFRDHGCPAYLGAGDDEGVGYGGARQALLFSNQSLKVLCLKYLRDKAQLIGCGGCENVLSSFKPLVGVGVNIAALDFVPDFACRNQFT